MNRRAVPAQGALNLPVWLKSHQYQDPLGVMPTPWISAIGTDKTPFEWLSENPWALDLAQAHMKVHRKGRPVFFDALDLEKRFSQGATSSTVLFVDVGGGSGSQARTFRQRYPNLPGRVLLQDRPEVVQHMKAELASSGIEAEAYDFFTPQPVQGMPDKQD
jgi:demethylsterigmatocystin 6-O-methyltransferase